MISSLIQKSKKLIDQTVVDKVPPPLRDNGIVLSALALNALRQREMRGLTTCLREMHGLLDTSQAVALRVIHQLEREGFVTIGDEFVDRLAAPVALEQTVSAAFDRFSGDDAIEETA